MFSTLSQTLTELPDDSSITDVPAAEFRLWVAVCRGIRLRLPLLCGHLRAVGREAKLKEFSYG